MKKLLIVLLVATVTLARADDSKISPELRGYKSTQQVQVIVQYAPGTQVNCSGLFGFVGCLVNDVLKLGGAILGQLPLINGVVGIYSYAITVGTVHTGNDTLTVITGTTCHVFIDGRLVRQLTLDPTRRVQPLHTRRLP